MRRTDGIPPPVATDAIPDRTDAAGDGPAATGVAVASAAATALFSPSINCRIATRSNCGGDVDSVDDLL